MSKQNDVVRFRRRRAPRRSIPVTRRFRALLFWGLALLMLCAPGLGDAINGYATATRGCRVVGLIDGDTVVMKCAKAGMHRARLLGFDTPEVFSPKCTSDWFRGMQATWYLRYLLWSASHIRTAIDGEDRYGRKLVTLFINSVDAARLMQRAEMARSYHGGIREGWCS